MYSFKFYATFLQIKAQRLLAHYKAKKQSKQHLQTHTHTHTEERWEFKNDLRHLCVFDDLILQGRLFQTDFYFCIVSNKVAKVVCGNWSDNTWPSILLTYY